MPFIRHTRDKRGYETTYVMHGYRPLQGPQRTRVLYLFRSPSHLKLGRRPLDEEIREALEHTHPDVSFDWSTLGRESAMMRAEEPRDRDRDRDRDRHARSPRPGPPPAARPQPSVPVPIPVVLDDQSLLGRALGAERAARFRVQYGELLQRIARRSRTPEDRDRLTDRAQRLNPDEWPDDAVIHAHAETFQADWEALVAELPARRRGRRGGRRRERPGGESGGPDGPGVEHDDQDPTEGEAEASGIMAGGRVIDASPDREEVDGSDSPAGDRPDSGALGAESREVADQPAGDRFPGDD